MIITNEFDGTAILHNAYADLSLDDEMEYDTFLRARGIINGAIGYIYSMRGHNVMCDRCKHLHDTSVMVCQINCPCHDGD